MRRGLIVSIMLLAAEVSSASDRGFCPPTPAKPNSNATAKSAKRTPPAPDAQFVGTVTLMAVISDTGYVCDAQVIRGLDKETDKRAEDSLRQGQFRPAYKDGHAIPVVVSVDVNYWRKDGELIQVPPNFSPTSGSAHLR